MQPICQGQSTLLIQKQYYGVATKKRCNIANKNRKINPPNKKNDNISNNLTCLVREAEVWQWREKVFIPSTKVQNFVETYACCVLARRVGNPIVDVSALVEA